MARRICVVGVGAVGAAVAARLLAAGENVVLYARGARLTDLRAHGLRVTFPDASLHQKVVADCHTDFGIQDLVFIAAKAQDLPTLLPSIMPMVGPKTTVVPLVNGIPFWYLQHAGGCFDGQAIRAVDPHAELCKLIPANRTVGCVVYLNATRESSGVVTVQGRQNLIVGGIDGAERERASEVAHMLSRAGFSSNVTERIRAELWTKVALNLATNPLSVVSEATLVAQFTNPQLLSLVTAVIKETSSVAAALDMTVSLTLEQMLATGRQAGHYETSMLQDFRAGRPLELDAIAFAVLELARRVGVNMPATQSIVELCRYKAGLRVRA